MGVPITNRDNTVAIRVETKGHVPVIALISGASSSDPPHESHVAGDEDVGRDTDQRALQSLLVSTKHGKKPAGLERQYESHHMSR